MTLAQIVFLIVGVIIIASAVMVVSVRNIVHASLWLIVSLFTIAVLFVLLEANFFAVIEVVIYIGAISILIIFAIMLTRRVMQDTGPQTHSTWWVSALIALGSFAALVVLFLDAQQRGIWPARPSVDLSENVATLGAALASTEVTNAAGTILPGYILPFEMVSVMLVLALIGAIAIALPPAKSKN